MQLFRHVVAGLVLSAAAVVSAAAEPDRDPLNAAIGGAQRSAESVARDAYRHPGETLRFFGIAPDMTVVEIWPGGGWYTEILAPYLRDQGKLYAAHFNADSSSGYYRKSRRTFVERLAANPAVYDRVEVTSFDPPELVDIAPPGSADAVVTFRNVHNWYFRGGGDERVVQAFEAMFRALKPGGVLGVVEHRLPAAQAAELQKKSGYMHEAYVIAMAERAGFKLAGKSGINANPRDTADHPEGVWTLPPSLRAGDTDREKYLAIGESDRMTLKFVKP